MSVYSRQQIRDATRHIARALVTLQARAMKAGFPRTARALNQATQKLGWEAAAKLEKHK